MFKLRFLASLVLICAILAPLSLSVSPVVAQDNPDVTTLQRVPLIFLPGIGGSELVNVNGEQWPRVQDTFNDDSGDRFLLTLRLAADGQNPFSTTDPAYTTMRVGDILRVEPLSVYGIDFSQDIYATTIATLQAAGYRERVDLFTFPFDWRKNLTLESNRLISFIDQVRQQTGAARVDILAHSMGGLVTRVALANPNSVGKIRKVLTAGTPVLGATKALGVLQYRQPCFIDIPGILFWKPDCLIDPATLQEVGTNFTGLYQLLPSRNFDLAVRPPLNIDRDTNGDGRVEGLQNYTKWSAIVRASRNSGLVTQSDTFHQTYNSFTLADPTVQYTRLVGDSLDTLTQIREYCGWSLIFWRCSVTYEMVKGPGDGTVPRGSADLYNPTNGFDLRGNIPNVYVYSIDHNDLVKNSSVMSYITSYFSSATTSSRAALDAAAAIDPNVASMMSTDPQALSGVEIETVGPVQGAVADAAGNRTGEVLNETIQQILAQEAIPQSSYQTFAGTQTFFVNAAGSYTANLTVTAAEPVRLRVRSYANDQINGQAIFNVAAPANATLQLAFATDQSLDSLRVRIDNEADGTVDAELTPFSVVLGPAAADRAAPTTTLALEPLNGRQVRVTLTANDQRDGSGIAATYYRSVGASGEPTRYSGPFVLQQGQQIEFASVDKAGNTEVIRSATLRINRISPLLECVADNGNGSYTAYFSYNNPNAFAVTLPLGANNRFIGTTLDRGQPTTFTPGRSPEGKAAFSTVFSGGRLTWVLNGRTATASAASPRCAAPVR